MMIRLLWTIPSLTSLQRNDDTVRTNQLRGMFVALTLIAGYLVCSPQESAAEEVPRGIDVILLIDASGSMSHNSGDLFEGQKFGNWDGSDVDRVRWDAVKLLLDLLDADDRILIRRFNHTCPAEPYMPKEELVYGPFRSALEGHELRADQLFPDRFVKCDRAGRAQVEECLTHVNSPLSRKPASGSDQGTSFAEAKDGRTLDQGATNIFHALTQVHKDLGDVPERPKRVILLTDGCDNFIDRYFIHPQEPTCTVDEEKLAEEMSPFLGKGVPVFTVGLNLTALDDIEPGSSEKVTRYNHQTRAWESFQTGYEQRKALGLLNAMSSLTGGTYKDVQNATQLRGQFEELIRTLKGLWYKTEPNARRKALSIPITSSVSDFRLLASVPLDSPPSAKAASEPPRIRAGHWEGSQLPEPAFRQGTYPGSPLYALWFGGSDGDGGSPYASLIGKQAIWVVPLDEDRPIDITEFKDIPVDFGWPPEKKEYFRHELAVVQLQAKQSQLNARHITWEMKEAKELMAVRMFPADQNEVEEHSDIAITSIDHSSVKSPNESPLSLRWELSAMGTDRSTVIAGFRREFSQPWTYSVLNELPYNAKIKGSTGLTRMSKSIRFDLNVIFENAVPKIPMRAVFVPPTIGGKSLESRIFTITVNGLKVNVEPGQDKLTYLFNLDNGSAEVKLSVDTEDKSLVTDEEFSPGTIGFVPEISDLSGTNKPIEFSIPLQLNRPQLGFFADGELHTEVVDQTFSLINEQSASDKWQAEEVVYLSPRSADIDGNLSLTLNYADGGTPTNASGEKTEFSDNELQICGPDGEPLSLHSANTWIVPYEKNPVQLTIKTRMPSGGWKPSSEAHASLSAAGTGFTTGSLPLHWKFEPRRVQVDPPSETPEVEPGNPVSYALTAVVMSGKNDCILTIKGNSLEFKTPSTSNAEKHSFFCNIDTPWGLQAAAGGSHQSVEKLLILKIPSKAPVGEYEATVEFSDQVRELIPNNPQPAEAEATTPESTGVCQVNSVKLKLVLDRLTFAVQSMEPTSDKPAEDEDKWVNAVPLVAGDLSVECFGWLREERSYWIRVRPEYARESASLPQVDGERFYIEVDTDKPPVPDQATLTDLTESGISKGSWLGKLTIPAIQNRDPDNPYRVRLSIHKQDRLKKTVTIRLPLLELRKSLEASQKADQSPDSPIP